MRRLFISLFIFINTTILLLTSSTGQMGLTAEPVATASPVPDLETQLSLQVEQAIYDKIIVESEYVLGLLVHEEEVVDVKLSADNSWSSAYLLITDPSTGESLPIEPGLVLAQSTATGWEAILPSDPEWVDALKAAPSDLISDELKETWLTMYATQQLALTTSGPFGGYKLPWEAGKTVWLSQSVSHDRYIPSENAHFAFDFYIPQTMYNLYASKAGFVWYARWHVENNNHDGLGNYLVIQDPTTSPTTYQLYLHLAKDSIPVDLRERGASVVQGQFIGIADNTGQSSGHHLHFQVHTNPDSYWGTAIDITFSDVDINGGRPRRCDSIYCDRPYCKSTDVCDDFRSFYVSGNQVAGDIVPPTGSILKPTTGALIDTKTVQLVGTASDDSGLDKAQFIANINGIWKSISKEFYTEQFTYDWNLCADNVPDGPVSVALKIWDLEGNVTFGLPGLIHFTKAYTCPPPPSCVPNDDQIALFTEPNFGGICTTLNIGDYAYSSQLGNIGDDSSVSIRVGTDVLATLYADAYFGGRGETFVKDDSNLADNLIGVATTTSVMVRDRTNPPEPVYTLIAPEDGAYLIEDSSTSLSWRDPGGATEYQVDLDTPGGLIKSPWLSLPVWHLDNLSLSPGNYSWKVNSRNCASSSCLAEPSEESSSFTVLPSATAIDSPITAPFFDDMESGTNGWIYSGLWNRINTYDTERVYSLTHSWYYGDNDVRNYRDGTPNAGDLTSPPIYLPDTNENYLLSFWYRYETESPATHWDQRWIQVSEDGGPFENILQLNDDLTNYWLHPVINLSDYRGATIRVRLHFETLDRALNDYEGWYIDDFEISTIKPFDCVDDDNSPESATLIEYGQSINRNFCPQGDVDYFTFKGTAGDRIVVDIDSAEGAPEDQDLVLFLLDGDGTSVLAEHDDEVYSIRRDPHLGYHLTRSGTYYLKVRAWSHPSPGGEDYQYSIKLLRDNSAPTANFIYPKDENYFTTNKITLSLSASDNKSGVSHVEFLWHSSDWLFDSWEIIGEDWEAEDNIWRIEFDLSTLIEQTNMAFYANIYDWAGNWYGVGVWQLGIDRTPPVTALQPIFGTKRSTAILLTWTSSDNLSGLDYFNIQSASFDDDWVDNTPNPDGGVNQTWYIAEPTSIYEFRMRGVDRAGNREDYPVNPELTVVIPDVDTLCANPDIWEVDNTPATASLIKTSDPLQYHNLCNPNTPNHDQDEDWVKFSVLTGRTYQIRTEPLDNSPAALSLDLIAANGSTVLASAEAGRFGEPTILSWTADRSGIVYIRMKQIDGNIYGEDVSYSLVFNELVLYTPFIYKNQSNSYP
jgi:murein DD-endopeptidase MepM/ murein hydrolase activator NlpD